MMEYAEHHLRPRHLLDKQVDRKSLWQAVCEQEAALADAILKANRQWKAAWIPERAVALYSHLSAQMHAGDIKAIGKKVLLVEGYLTQEQLRFLQCVADAVHCPYEEMNLLEYEIVECWKEGGGAQGPPATKIKLGSKPDVSAWISGPLASKLPEVLEYFDEVTYQPQALASPPYQLLVRSEVPFLGDKGRFESHILIEPVGQGRCRHTLEQTIEFKGLWGLGAVAKKLAKKSLQDTFDDLPGVIDKWLTFRQELLQTPKGRARLLAGRPHVEGVEWIDRQTAAVEGHKRGKAQHRHRRHGRQRADEAAAGKGRSDASGGGGAPKQGTPDVNPAARSPFDEAAAGAPASAPPSPPATATEPAVSGEERAGGAGGCGGAGGAEEFEDASEAHLHGEQSLGGTVWFSPATSLAPTASTEGTQPDAAAAAAVEPAAAVAGNEAVPPAAPAAQAEERRGAKGSEGGGSGGSVGGASESGYSAGSSEGSEEVEEHWGKTAPWRAYYQQHGVTPTRASHLLPDVLVERVIDLSGRRPVTVKKMGDGKGQQAGGAPAGRGRMRRMLGACSGRHSTAAEAAWLNTQQAAEEKRRNAWMTSPATQEAQKVVLSVVGVDCEAEIEQLLAELARLEKRYGPDSPAVPFVQNHLSQLYFCVGRYQEAVEASKVVQKCWIKLAGADSDMAAMTGLELGKALAAAGHPGDARDWLVQGLSVFNRLAMAQSQKVRSLAASIGQDRAAGRLDAEAWARARAALVDAQESKLKLDVSLYEAGFYGTLCGIMHNRFELQQGLSSQSQSSRANEFRTSEERMMETAFDGLLVTLVPGNCKVTYALRELSRAADMCKRQSRVRSALQSLHRRLANKASKVEKAAAAAAAAAHKRAAAAAAQQRGTNP
ncbi:serine threonine kinase [Micractinium conductrix]|uniref:Serine threonine kinase n=1 Tax=Micractinium conductrix TaxID=554055 RepID=A0A2P6VII7_9CHLO|nr:serine threonine kinase [Micractinium conductrix]|eukprot:PSC73913.1 serine threonine kinase [Micractinium conductrix]